MVCFVLSGQNLVPAPAVVATPLEPPTLNLKLRNYVILTLGPRALFVPAVSAVRRVLDPPGAYPHDWRAGPGAWARNYGNALASRSSRETARFLTSALLHEDFRYRPSASTNPLTRGFHALGFTFIDRSDSGHNRIAFANFAGAGSAGFVGNLYLPAGYNNLSHAGTRTATAFAGFAIQNLVLEFTPELLLLKHRFHIPLTTAPVPKWWTKGY